MPDCGCFITMKPVGYPEHTGTQPTIIYCPTHTAAFRLREALIDANKFTDWWLRTSWKEARKDTTDGFIGVVKQTRNKANAALALCEEVTP